MSYYRDVGNFHRKFDIPAFDPRKACEFPSAEILKYRTLFLREELMEFEKAVESQNLVEALDALADITYVALGTAHYFNAPFAQIWDEIQRANMERVKCTRENCPPDKQYRADMVIKPPDWKPPQIEAILNIHNQFARRMLRRTI
jgi:predicted HAD superfamily Cof-like phosphohydrolase